MNRVSIVIGASLGLVVGWAGARWLIAPQSPGRVPEGAAALGSDREPGSLRWLSATLRSRDGNREVSTARDYLTARSEGRARGAQSPYRVEVRGITWLQSMPMEAVIDLLEQGELRGPNEIGTAFARWVDADPVAAWEAIDRLDFLRDDRRCAQGPVYGYWARNNPLGLVSLLEELEPSLDRGRKVKLLTDAWLSVDAGQVAAALDRLEALSPNYGGLDRRRLREELLTAWVGQDEAAAVQWAESLRDDRDRNWARGLLEVARLNHYDKAEAVEYLLNQGDGEVMHSVKLPEFWTAWASSDPEKAIEKLATYPQGEHQESRRAMMVDVAKRAVVAWIMSDRKEEALQALEEIPDGYQRLQIARGFVEGASPNDPQLAARLLAELPESDARVYAAMQLVQDWTKRNLVEAGEWLVQQEPSPSIDGATAAFASALSLEDSAKAAAWADTIENREWQTGIRDRIYQRWREREPEAADQWREGWE